jgi:hypothetical protein
MSQSPGDVDAKFKFYEIVRIIVDSPAIHKSLINKEGIIVGICDPDDHDRRDYGVHVNEYGETFRLPEQALEPTGRFGSPRDIVNCNRRKWGR